MIAVDRIATTPRIVRLVIECLHLAPIGHKRSDNQTVAGVLIFPNIRILRTKPSRKTFCLPCAHVEDMLIV